MLEFYNPRCEPPWTAEEMQTLVAHGFRYAQNQAGSESAEADFADEPVPVINTAEAKEHAKRRRFHLYSYHELKDWQAPKWRVDRHIPDGGLAMVYGKPKVGKTFWALDVALSVATGRDFHGVKVEHGRVVYVAAEGGPARLGDRVSAWLHDRGVHERELEGQWQLAAEPILLSDHSAGRGLSSSSTRSPGACRATRTARRT
jgi:hypothetical protein